MPVVLTLYQTAGCHLCDKAKDILWPLLSEHQLIFQDQDIAETDQLIDRYGVRIPVLAKPDGQELDWPFTSHDILSFLKLPV